MAIVSKHRSPAVKFDDIPIQLPKGSVPPDTSLTEVAHKALVQLNDLHTDDLTEGAVWRDLLSFTGTYRTFHSRDNVFETLTKLSQVQKRSEFTLKDHEPRLAKSPGGLSWVDVDVDFSIKVDDLAGSCAGTVSVIPEEDGKWRIWMLRTWLECFDGFGHPDQLEPSQRLANGITNGHTHGMNGMSNGVHHLEDDKSVQVYDAVIVGAGQAGLSTAGRLKALNLSYVVLERHAQVGDVWGTRYESLKWHTSKECGNLPFGHTYPPEDEYMMPISRIAAGHRAWAEKYGINVRTKTSVDSAVWSDSDKQWTVTTSSPDGQKTMVARNLVLAIGPGHLSPASPEWATAEKIANSGFRGTIMHSTDYKSCKGFEGKRGVVIGTANTGHDVAEDMANAGMETTMIQRGATFVYPAEWLHRAEDMHYHADMDTALADREAFTYPNKVLREIINRAVWQAIKNNPDRFDAVEKAGFKVERYGDIYNNLYVRFGGHYVDIGASARIAKGEIKVKTEAVRALNEQGLLFEDGSELSADLIVLCTGFDHDFRKDAARIVGRDAAEQMDDFWGVDAEGEIRGHAKFAGHPNLYYHGGDTRMGRFFSRFIALQVQAAVLGKPMHPYLS